MSKTKVSILDTAYHVNPENKTVVCVLKCSYNTDINHSSIAFISDYDLQKFFPDTNYKARKLTFTVKGKSKCHDNDTFDEELGKKIALARAEIKMFERARLINNLIRRQLCQAAEEFNRHGSDSLRSYYKEIKYLKTLLNKQNHV